MENTMKNLGCDVIRRRVAKSPELAHGDDKKLWRCLT
jgi:hypothetical protein